MGGLGTGLLRFQALLGLFLAVLAGWVIWGTIELKGVLGRVDIITSTLKAGGDVKIAGFGTFKVADTKAKTGRNPAEMSSYFHKFNKS